MHIIHFATIKKTSIVGLLGLRRHCPPEIIAKKVLLQSTALNEFLNESGARKLPVSVSAASE